jgi:hypothetical protein
MAGVMEERPTYSNFLTRAAYNQLPTSSNLAAWALRENLNCVLCGKTGTLRHILAGCSISLSQGRYKWRHNMVLRELAGAIDQVRENQESSEG